MRPTLRPIVPIVPIALGIAVALQAASLAAHAAGTVQVAYVQPEQFTDAGAYPGGVEDTLGQLTRYFATLASRHLPDGQALRIEVLDIDLAGTLQPWLRGGQEVRLLRDRADWPRIKLRYTLEATGQAPRTSEQQISDTAYMRHFDRLYGSESLVYEKRMLGRWFSAEFGAASDKDRIN